MQYGVSETRSRFGGASGRKRKFLWAFGVLAWSASAAAGLSALQRYKSTAAEAPPAPPSWPSASQLSRVPGKPTLVLLAHPKCPCTKATMRELAVLMDRVGPRLTAHVLFMKPRGVEQDWEKSETWSIASGIPGVSVRADDQGREAELFGAKTSGQALLYDAAGKQVFAGGITISRGHEGENPGLQRIVSLVTRGTAELPSSPVFGCDLDDPKYLAQEEP